MTVLGRLSFGFNCRIRICSVSAPKFTSSGSKNSRGFESSFHIRPNQISSALATHQIPGSPDVDLDLFWCGSHPILSYSAMFQCYAIRAAPQRWVHMLLSLRQKASFADFAHATDISSIKIYTRLASALRPSFCFISYRTSHINYIHSISSPCLFLLFFLILLLSAKDPDPFHFVPVQR